MRKIKRIQLIALLLIGLVTFNSCVNGDDFTAPNITIAEPSEVTADNTIGADAVAGIYIQEQIDQNNINNYDPNTPFDDSVFFTFQDTGNFMEGYVISSDEAGNYFEEIVIQDKLEDPTFGVKVLIDVNPLYVSYEVGRKVYIRLDGLTIGIDSGVLTLGILQGTDLEKIPAPLQNNYILRSSQKGNVVPKVVDISSLSDRMTNQYIAVENAQFLKTQIDPEVLTFAAEPLDEFDGERFLESCAGGQIVFSTSTFSDFKGLRLPTGRGRIEGILQKNFFGDEYNFVVNSPESINFDSTDRCDPIVLECNDPINGASTTTIFSEDFESFGTFASEGWTNVNISGGATEWVEGSFSGNAYAQISGFNANANDIDVWLITPAINFDGTTEEVLNFDVQTNFNNGNILTVWISRDFTGDPTTATWEQLDTVIPTGNANGFGSFEAALQVNLSCLSGDIHIGFFYEGADPGPTTRYHVDNVVVSGK